MWAAIKALPIFAKLGIVLAILTALVGIYAVGYKIGSNTVKLQDAKTVTKIVTQQGQVTDRILTKYVNKIQYVDRVKYQTQEVIKESLPETSKMSFGWVYTYNSSLVGAEPDAALVGNSQPTAITDKQAMQIIAANNANNLANVEQLKALQEWIREQEKISKQVISGKSAVLSSMYDQTRPNTISYSSSQVDGATSGNANN